MAEMVVTHDLVFRLPKEAHCAGEGCPLSLPIALLIRGLCPGCAAKRITELNAQVRAAFEEGWKRGARWGVEAWPWHGNLPADYDARVYTAAAWDANAWLKEEER